MRVAFGVAGVDGRLVSSPRCLLFSTGRRKKDDNIKRYPIEWKKKAYYDEKKFEEELRRVFDVCHGCRRCFSLCDSFPILFEEIDQSKTEELDSVPSSSFKKVSDKCTLCDLCFTNKCPYVPPHEFNIDFPHLMLQYRAIEQKEANVKAAGGLLDDSPLIDPREGMKSMVEVLPEISRELVKKPSSIIHKTYANQDFTAPLATRLSPIVNKATRGRKLLARRALEMVAGIDQDAPLPEYVPHAETFLNKFVKQEEEKEYERKVVVYVTCFVNNNRPKIGHSVVNLLRKSNVYVEACFPSCCGMPQLEQGLVGEVSQKAEKIATQLNGYVERGFEVISLTPSCTLMIKQEWPLLLSENEVVKRVADHTYEVSEYLWNLQKSKLLTPENPPKSLPGQAFLHQACHMRAQNIGPRAKDLLALIPDLKVEVSERCSGHGGIFGFQKEHYETALRIGGPVFEKASAMLEEHQAEQCYVLSECPMAVDHIGDGLERKGKVADKLHPVELLEKSIL